MLAQAFYDWRQWMIRSLLDPYFIFWGKCLIRRWQPRTIVVTGASGKTTLLNMLKVQLGQADVAYSTRANTNIGVVCNLVGEGGVTASRWRWLALLVLVPYKSLTCRRSESLYVVEFDIARPLAGNNIVAALKPEVCLLTNVTASHSEKFDRLSRRTGQSPLHLLTDCQIQLVALAGKVVYLPAAQREFLDDFLPEIAARVIWVKSELAAYQVSPKETVARVGRRKFRFGQPQPPQIGQQLHFLLALVSHLKLKPVSDFRSMPIAPGRSTGLAGRRDSWLIDSSYNSNPASMATMLELISQIDAPARWAVLGDYVELGQQGPAAHRQLAGWLEKSNLDRLFLYGRRLEVHCWPQIQKNRQLAAKAKLYRSQAALLSDLMADLSGGEAILFKGAGFLENLVEQLLADPADVARLCRREPRAARRRAVFLARQQYGGFG